MTSLQIFLNVISLAVPQSQHEGTVSRTHTCLTATLYREEGGFNIHPSRFAIAFLKASFHD